MLEIKEYTQEKEILFGKKITTSFLDAIFTSLMSDKIDISNYELDHICYRVSSQKNYEVLKQKLWNFWELLTENIISWRVIATFKLFEPIIYHERKIYILEIPSPKHGSIYQDWFEHVEFVINESFDDFMNKYSHINFDIKDINKKINPDIRRKYDDISVKFHQNSLEYIVNNFE